MTKSYRNQNASAINRLLKSAVLVIAGFAFALNVNAQTITTNFTSPFTFFAAPANIAFVIENTNASSITLTGLGQYVNTTENNSVWELYYSATSLSGVGSTVPGAAWTLIATSPATPVAANGIVPVFTGLSFNIPAGTQYRFVMKGLGPGSVRYVNASPVPNTTVFANAGVNLKVGLAAIPGGTTTNNVGYSGSGTALGTTPRSWHGSITFTVNSTPCTDPPTAGTATKTPTTPVCTGSPVTLSLTGNTGGTGQTYQWFSDVAQFGSYSTAVSGLLTSPSHVINPSTTLWYRAAVTCGATTNTSVPVQVTVNPGLNGTYTINSGAVTGGTNYQTFAAAISALGCGVSGPVTFNVVAGSGPYNEQVTIPVVAGVSSTNTITFNGNGRTLTFAPPSTAKYVLRLDGADYIIINNLTIVSTDVTYGWGILLMNAADNNQITNCTVDVSAVTNTTASNSTGITASASITTPTTAGNNTNNSIISGNTVIGGYQGIRINGQTTGTNGVNNQVINNTVRDFYADGISISNTGNILISGNDINRATRIAVTTFTGIEIATGNINALIEKNRIHNTHGAATTQTGTAYGIYASAADVASGSEIRVVNNLLYDFNSLSGPVYPLYNSGSDGYYYYHNTIAIGDQNATGGVVRGFYQTTAASNIQFRNNNVSITRTGTGDKHCIYLGAAGSSIISNNNNLYVNSPGGTNGVGFLTVNYPTLLDWQTNANGGIYDAASQSVNPGFVNPGLGNYTPSASAINDIGANLAIATDITGAPRGATPDPGAYEFSPPTLDASITWVAPAPPVTAGLNTVTVNITNNQSTTITSLDLGYTDGITPQTQSFTGLNITIGNSQQFSFTTQYSITGPVSLTGYITTVNGLIDANQNNDTTAVQSLCPSLSGVYTINSGAATGGTNFQTFTAAVDRLICGGVAGAVTFNVTGGSGPYIEQLIIPAIGGVSATNTITFNGNGATLTFAPTITGERHVIRLDGADYITLNNLNIISTAGTYGWGVHFFGEADNNNISNSTISVNNTVITSTNFAAIVMSNSFTSYTTAGNNGNNNTITGNTLSGGYYTVIVYGNSTAGLQNLNNTISNNIITDSYSYSLYLLGQKNVVVSGNEFSRPNRNASTTTAAVFMTTGCLNSLVEKNRIHSYFDAMTANTSTCYSIYVAADGTASEPNRIENNLVYNQNGAGDLYGIYNSGGEYMKAYHNTIAHEFTGVVASGETYGFYQTTAVSGIEYINNIITVKRNSSAAKYCLYFNTPTSTIISNYNDLYINGTGAGAEYVGYHNAINYATLANWQTANGGIYDGASQSVNPVYTNAAGGNYSPLAAQINDIGTPVGVATDILNATRSVSNPDPGAYEFTPVSTDASIVWIAPLPPVNAGLQTVTVEITNNQSTVITSLDLAYTDGGTPVTQSFTGLNIPLAGTQQFSFTTQYNLTGNAMLSAYITNVNGLPDGNQGNDTTAVQDVCVTLAGAYTINASLPASSTNFQNFTSAVARLTYCGVSAPVTFTVGAGTGPYTEQVIIPAINGASATNTITFNGNGRTLQFGPTVSAARSIIKLDGADYITINNLDIKATTATYGWGIHFMNQADNNTISNCVIRVDSVSTSTTNFFGVVMSNSNTAVTTAGNNGNNNLITGNFISGGYNTLILTGNSTPGSENLNNTVSNNIIRNAYSNSFELLGQKNAVVSGNNVSRPTRTNSTTTSGIYLSTGCPNALIEKNRVHNFFDAFATSTSTCYGIYVSADGTALEPTRVENNLVYNLGGNGSLYGIYNTSGAYMLAYHNTIAHNTTTSTAGTTFGLYQTGAVSGVDYRNNIVFITRGGSGEKVGVAYVTTGATVISNNNDIYVAGAGSGAKNIGTYGTTDYTTLATWQTANGGAYDAQSKSINPGFVSPGTGDFTPSASQINGIGATGTGVTTDITGAPRSPAPDPGAYEFTSVGLDAGITWVAPTAPLNAGSHTITIDIVNTQTTTITSLDLAYTDGGTPVTQSFTGLSIAPSTSQQFSFTTPYSLIGNASLIAYVSAVNGILDTDQSNDTTAVQSLCVTMSGVYTINSTILTGGNNFQSFTAAINQLSCAGINGPITFTVTNGPYNEQISIPQITGTTATNTVTFNGGGAVLGFASSNTNARAVIKLDGADYITINNLIINANAGTYGWGIQLTNQANNNSITNCTINLPANTSSTNFLAIAATSSNTAFSGQGDNANNTTISGCTVNSGYYGITFYGATGTYTNNNQVLNCAINDSYSYPVYFIYNTNPVISGNNIQKPNRTTFTTGYGIALSTGVSGSLVEKNRIHNLFGASSTSTSACYPIYHLGDGTAGAPNKVINNLVYDINHNGTIYGIYNSTSPYMQAYHNTISLDYTAATAGITTGIYQTGAAAGIDLRNNIITIARGGSGVKAGLDFGTTTSTITSNRNDIFVNSTGNGAKYIGIFGTTNYATLVSWQTANGGIYDAQSVSTDPNFTNPAGGNYKPNSVVMNDLGVNVNVTTDILGLTRSITNPDLGAYEFDVTCLANPTYPANGGTACADLTGTILSWPALAGATQYDVYFGTTAPASTLVSDNQTGLTYNSGALTAGTTYYWSIVPQVAGATACNTWSFTVNPLPDPTASSNSPICAGTSLSLTSDNIASGQSSGNSYSWTGPGSYSSLQQNPTVTSTATTTNAGTYTVVVTNQFLCTASFNAIVTVNPNPVLSTGTITGVSCIGLCDGSATINASGATPDYLFTDGSNFIVGTSSGTFSNILCEGPSTITVYDNLGCASNIIVTLGHISAAPPAASVLVPPINNLPASACNGTVVNNINVPSVALATQYIWDGPTGTTFNSSSNPYTSTTPTANITFGNPNGSGYYIGIQAANGCGTSTRKVQWVRGTTGVPAAISGVLTACPNSSQSYSTTAVTGATTYLWTITGDATVSGTGLTSTVNFGPSFTTGTLCVAAQTSCYTSPAKCITISRFAPVVPAFIGTFTACIGQTLTYSVPAQAGVASYQWTLPPNTSGSSTTNSINVTFNAGFFGGDITVRAVSICGDLSGPRTRTIVWGVPTVPPLITGPLTGLCGQTIVYSCPAQAGATFTWTVPAGATINSGQGSNAISVTFGIFTTSTVCVSTSNACGASAQRCITVTGRPLTPGAITATPSAWCANTSGIQFDVDVTNLTGSYTLSWLYPGPTVATYSIGGGNTTQLVLDWISGSGPVNVTASNACGNQTRTSTQASSCREGEEVIASENTSLQVYPNPTSGNVNIEFSSLTEENAQMTVVDVTGRTVISQNIRIIEGLNNVQLDLSKVAKGIYMLNVNSAEATSKVNIVVE